MPFKQAVIFALATLAFLTALGALSPLLLLSGVFVAVCGLWAAVRMPPFWRYAHTEPKMEDLVGVYELANPFPHHQEFSLELNADGTFQCRRFPLFTVWPPIMIEHALSGSGTWIVEMESPGEWVVSLALQNSHPVDIPGQPNPASGIAIDHLEVSFRIGKRGDAYTLMTWAGGFLSGRTIEFNQQMANAASAMLASDNAGPAANI
jgi:hypothetical protein